MTAAVVYARDITLLNATYEELGQLTFPKAARLLALGKAVVHEIDETKGRLREFAYPKAIRLVYFVKVNYAKMHGKALFTKHGVLKRDKFRCAYCGGVAKTIDHVKPKSRGGSNSWGNTVASCFLCNNRKDNRTPKEAGMTLLWNPYTPSKMQLMGR